MRKINKNDAPHISCDAFYKKTHLNYCDINGDDRQTIRTACIAEQKGLCAFCCCPITVNNSQNAHLISQTTHPQLSLKWDNIVASCSTASQCNANQGPRVLPVTPLMDECEQHITFDIRGHAHGTTENARSTLEILNLNNPSLIAKRKNAIEAFFFINAFDPVEEYDQWDEETYRLCIDLCEQEDEQGQLLPYAPVLASVFRQQLQRLRN